ncbi:MAG: CopG family transcriptional regulator [Candidatus Methanomethylicaceae archaeon]
MTAEAEQKVITTIYLDFTLKRKLEDLATASGKSISSILEEILAEYLGKVKDPKPPLYAQLKAERARAEFQQLKISLVKTLLAIRDGHCSKYWVKEWYPKFEARLIDTVKELEPLAPDQERAALTMAEVAKAAKEIDPESDSAYMAARNLFQKLHEGCP